MNIDIASLLKNGRFPLCGLIADENTTEEELVTIGGKIHETKQSKFIYFKGENCSFLGHPFHEIEFIFRNGKLDVITIDWPQEMVAERDGDPYENHEKAKYEFCKKLLSGYLDLSVNEKNTEFYYTNEKYRLECKRCLYGKAMFMDGKIRITLK